MRKTRSSEYASSQASEIWTAARLAYAHPVVQKGGHVGAAGAHEIGHEALDSGRLKVPVVATGVGGRDPRRLIGLGKLPFPQQFLEESGVVVFGIGAGVVLPGVDKG